MHLRITVQGDDYKVFVDGSTTPITTLTTSAFASGTVGLFDNSLPSDLHTVDAQTFDNFQVSTLSSCQVNVTTKWSQGVNHQDSGNGPPGGGPWGDKTYDDYNPTGGACILGDSTTDCLIRRLGCSLTTLAMALKFAGVDFVNVQALDPGTLNDFMKSPNNYFNENHDVKLDATARAISAGSLKLVTDLPGDTQEEKLDQTLCMDFPVIVGVHLTEDEDTGEPVPEHYVLVIGKQNNKFQIVDPGDHSNTTLNTAFLIRGCVADPPGDISGLDLTVGNNTELLVIDPVGRRSGFNDTTRVILNEIPHSVHFIDSLEDDETGAPPNGRSHSIQIFQPLQGTYHVVITVLKQGPYILEVDTFSQDGSTQPAIILQGNAVPGSTTSYDIQFVSTPGGVSNVIPIAACQNVTVPTGPGVCTASASVDKGSFDPDGDPITLVQLPAGPYSLGTTAVTLTVTDSKGASASCSATVTVIDQTPPAITCPGNQTAECTGPNGAAVSFSPTVSDNCSVGAPSCTPPSGSTFPIGSTPISCSATDGSGNSSDCSSAVTVQDTTPPVISAVSASPSVLWPPNHKMVPVTVTASASDLCSTAPVCKITSVSSNEPVNGTGDGDTAPDWVITGNLTVNLRAERSGSGSGRVYTITVACTDTSRNSSTKTTTVTVPHGQGKK